MTCAQDPHLADRLEQLIVEEWPGYAYEARAPRNGAPFTDRGFLTRRWPAFQFALLDGRTLVAGAHTVPLRWEGAVDDLPDDGWDWAIARAAADTEVGRPPTVLCGLFVTVATAHRGRGLARAAVDAFVELAREAGLPRVVIPVRPPSKLDHPEVSMAEFLAWTRPDGLPSDPWLRTHVRAGGRIVGPCHRAWSLGGSVADWERWSGRPLPVTGRYVLPGCLVPVDIDVEADDGLYVEPNVWVVHEV